MANWSATLLCNGYSLLDYNQLLNHLYRVMTLLFTKITLAIIMIAGCSHSTCKYHLQCLHHKQSFWQNMSETCKIVMDNSSPVSSIVRATPLRSSSYHNNSPMLI